MESPLKLEDLLPDTGTFYLSATQKTYRLRKVTLADEVWLKKTFGGDQEIQKIFKMLDVYKIARIAWHQMFNEDKVDFKKQTVTLIDDEGNEAKVDVGGVDLLFQLVSGLKEKQDLLLAMLTTLGVSRPVLDKLEAKAIEQEEEKKKKLTGLVSSTVSAQNTAGV